MPTLQECHLRCIVRLLCELARSQVCHYLSYAGRAIVQIEAGEKWDADKKRQATNFTNGKKKWDADER